MSFFVLSSDPTRHRLKTQVLIPLILGALLFFPGTAPIVFCEVIHIGISPQTVPSANINDALAAIKVWTQNSARAHGIESAFEVAIIDSTTELCEGLDNQQLEIVSTPTHDMLQLPPGIKTVFVSVPTGSFPVRYALVAHRDNTITTPRDLENSTVVIPRGDFMQLAEIWFDAYVQEYGHPPESSFLTKLTDSEDVFKAGMQVFFRQIDAAVIPRNALNRMGKRNPQIQNDLFIIGESMPLIPIVLIVRPSWQTPLRHAMETVLSELHTTPLGKQVLAVFHCSRLEKHPITILEPTLSFLQNQKKSTQQTGDNEQK